MNELALLRRIGSAVEARLRKAGLEARAHVGHDVRDAWRERIPDLPSDASLNWVAIDFPGLPVWDAHLGVLADFGYQPPRSTVGLHVLEEHWQMALAVLAGGDATRARLLEGDATRAVAVREVQLNDGWGELDAGNLEAEADRLAARATELYSVVQRVAAELAARLGQR